MSTLACTAPRRGTRRNRVISGPLVAVFLAEFCALTSFDLLISVTPGYAAAAGAGTAGAGLMTGALLFGTVAAELAAAALMRPLGHRALLSAGALLLGVPALALLPRDGLAVIAAVSVVRGFGFGLGTVSSGALTALLLPPERRGEGLGLFGAAATAPGVIALPGGVWLAGQRGIGLVVVLAAVTAVVPLAAFPRLPAEAGRGGPGSAGPGSAGPGSAGPGSAGPGSAGPGRGETAEGAGGLLGGLRRGGQLRPLLIFAASTVAAGVVVSFLPLAVGVSGAVATAGLLAQALTATVSRWWAGRQGDRSGHARLLVPALAIASAGLLAMIWLGSPVAVIAGMCLFGTGFGISENATFALMIDRMAQSGPDGPGTASALWNLAYDAGYGAGPAVFGLFVNHTGYPAAFALTGALMLAALPAARREHSAAAVPISDGASH